MPLKNLLFFLIIFICWTDILPQQSFTIIIDPAGDLQHTGREIYDTFERGLTLQCAQALKTELIKAIPNIHVILTRTQGEIIQPLDHARFANRLQPNLYLRIGFYCEPDMPSHVALFYYLQHPTDFWHKINYLQFYDIDQAHLLYLNVTKQLATHFLQTLENNEINSVFVSHGLFGIPLKPFVGIQVPALYLEAGLHKPTDWNYLIQPLLACIQGIV